MLFQKDVTLRFFHGISPLRTLYVNGSTADKNHIQYTMLSAIYLLSCAVKEEGPWSLVVVQTMTQYLLLLYTSSKFLLLSCTVKKHELVITENYVHVYIQQSNFGVKEKCYVKRNPS